MDIVDWNMPFDNNSSEHGVWNPYSKITCFCLYLYSLELGNPPLYAEANRVSRDMDLTYLRDLGPYLRTIGAITGGAERNREQVDKIKTGEMIMKEIGGVMHNLAGAILLWRGVSLKEEYIKPYEDRAVNADTVFLPGSTSCSQELKVALGFTFKNVNNDRSPVLFVISCQNFNSPSGVRMNNEAYTSYPNENEFLLMDGSEVMVIAVERDVIIHNEHEEMKCFNNKSLHIIHLYHPSYH